ncbi:MAG: hypothetical protein ACKO34_02380 [Vampirovibrionales bacterium]
MMASSSSSNRVTLILCEGPDDVAFLKSLAIARKLDTLPTWRGLQWYITRGSQAPIPPVKSENVGAILDEAQYQKLRHELLSFITPTATRCEVRLFWLVDTDTFSHEHRIQQIEETWQQLMRDLPPSLKVASPQIACITPYLEALYTQALHEDVRTRLETAIHGWELAVEQWLESLSTATTEATFHASTTNATSTVFVRNLDKKRLQAYLMALPFPYQQCKWSNPKAVQALIDLQHPCFDAVAQAFSSFLKT